LSLKKNSQELPQQFIALFSRTDIHGENFHETPSVNFAAMLHFLWFFGEFRHLSPARIFWGCLFSTSNSHTPGKNDTLKMSPEIFIQYT
jgi:hypothetical protein